jgi:hypothetical protein
MCQRTSMPRTFSTSRTHREAIHAQGHSGSNQKSTGVLADVCSDLLLLGRGLSVSVILGAASSVNAIGRPCRSRMTRVRGAWHRPLHSSPWRHEAVPPEPGGNLSRDEARERAALLSAEEYEVSLELRSAVRRWGRASSGRCYGSRPGRWCCLASALAVLKGSVAHAWFPSATEGNHRILSLRRR